MKTKYAIIIVFALAIAIRLYYFFSIDTSFNFSKYPYFAAKLINGQNIGYRIVDLSPFYLYLTSFWYYCFGPSWWTLKIIQSIFGAINCLLILAIGKHYFNLAVGIVASLMIAFYGNMIVLETTLEPTVYVVFFNLLTLLLLTVAKKQIDKEEPPFLYLMCSGVFAGLSIITKPNFLLFALVAVVFFLFIIHQTLTNRLLYFFAFSLSLSCIVFPVTLRNYILINDIVLVTADAGKVFYHANGPGANALEWNILDDGLIQGENTEPDYEHVLFRKTAERITGRKLLPSEASRFWFKQTIGYIKNDPVKYVFHFPKKFLFFFNNYELHYIAAAYAEYKKTLAFPLVQYAWIVSFGILGMLIGLKDWKRLWLLYGVFSVYLISCTIFLVQSRYRTPAVPYLILFAAFSIYNIYKWIKGRKVLLLFKSVFVVCILMLISYYTFQQHLERIDKWKMAVDNYYMIDARTQFSRAQYRNVISTLDKTINMAPSFSPAYNFRGKTFLLLKKYSMAVKDFEKVIELRPNYFIGYKNLGMLYLMMGKKEMAEPFLQKAQKMAPEDELIEKGLNQIKGEIDGPVIWEIGK